MSIATIINGDARRLPLPDKSVHVCITSPPYFGLRDYGTAEWVGGDDGCDHKQAGTRAGQASTLRNDGREHIGPYDGERNLTVGFPYRDLCGKCGARRVDRQIGLEASPDEFVAAMVEVFREVKRVLRDDGCAWVNLGDSYSSGGRTTQCQPTLRIGQDGVASRAPTIDGLGSKQLLMMPHRVALALQADGWIVRSDIVWHKNNPMPESVTDRPTKSHEYIFLLAKQERYYFDAEAVREKGPGSHSRGGNATPIPGRGDNGRSLFPDNPAGRNIRSVWTIPTEPMMRLRSDLTPERRAYAISELSSRGLL